MFLIKMFLIDKKRVIMYLYIYMKKGLTYHVLYHVRLLDIFAGALCSPHEFLINLLRISCSDCQKVFAPHIMAPRRKKKFLSKYPTFFRPLPCLSPTPECVSFLFFFFLPNIILLFSVPLSHARYFP